MVRAESETDVRTPWSTVPSCAGSPLFVTVSTRPGRFRTWSSSTSPRSPAANVRNASSISRPRRVRFSFLEARFISVSISQLGYRPKNGSAVIAGKVNFRALCIGSQHQKEIISERHVVDDPSASAFARPRPRNPCFADTLEALNTDWMRSPRNGDVSFDAIHVSNAEIPSSSWSEGRGQPDNSHVLYCDER